MLFELEDTDPAVGAERSRHRPEWMGREEGVGLEQLLAAKPDAADPLGALRDLGRHRRKRPRVEIPEPVLQLPRQAAPNLDVDTADARGDRRLPNPRVRQIREDAELSHVRLLPIADHQVSPKGRISTLNDHALRS